jgi:hypothetical protein
MLRRDGQLAEGAAADSLREIGGFFDLADRLLDADLPDTGRTHVYV